jgi:hypothetical protein
MWCDAFAIRYRPKPDSVGSSWLTVLGHTEEAIKTVPNVPLSHPFLERLIGTIRRAERCDSSRPHRVPVIGSSYD